MKSARPPKRPSPKRTRKATRYLWISKPLTNEWLTTGKAPKGQTLDLRRNEWKRLKRQRLISLTAFDRIAEIERAWDELRKAA